MHKTLLLTGTSLLLAACGTSTQPEEMAAQSSPAQSSLTAQALPNGTLACFYEHVDYRGASLCYTARGTWTGTRNISRLSSWWNDRVSSVRVQTGVQVDLFMHVNYGGATRRISADTASLVGLNFNDLTSSVRLTRPAPGTTPPTPPAPPPSPSAELDAKCTPRVVLENNDPANAHLLLDVTGADPTAWVQDIARKVCRTLYRQASEVPELQAGTYRLIVSAMEGVAGTGGNETGVSTEFSTRHLRNVVNAGDDLAREVTGIMLHEAAHVYQNDDRDQGGVSGGMIEAFADYVRYKNGYIPDGVRPDKSGHWSDGGGNTSFFLMWLDTQYPDAVYRLHLSMARNDGQKWTPESFRTITGKTADQLWAEYQAAN